MQTCWIITSQGEPTLCLMQAFIRCFSYVSPKCTCSIYSFIRPPIGFYYREINKGSSAGEDLLEINDSRLFTPLQLFPLVLWFSTYLFEYVYRHFLDSNLNKAASYVFGLDLHTWIVNIKAITTCQQLSCQEAQYQAIYRM